MSKPSPYFEAGLTLSYFLPSCPKPFQGTCFHANDEHFYCSDDCADRGEKIDMSRVEPLRKRGGA